jgi:hypothetical protein
MTRAFGGLRREQTRGEEAAENTAGSRCLLCSASVDGGAHESRLLLYGRLNSESDLIFSQFSSDCCWNSKQ